MRGRPPAGAASEDVVQGVPGIPVWATQRTPPPPHCCLYPTLIADV